MPHPAYGPVHRRVRIRLLAATPGGTPCPICGQAMWPGLEPLDLHHTDPAAKLAGKPGDVLAHRKCNRGERARRAEPAGQRARRQRARAALWRADIEREEAAATGRVW